MLLKVFKFFPALLFFLIIAITINSGCNNDNPVTPNNPFENYRYPYQNGINWIYKFKTVYYNIRPDSATVYVAPDTINGTGVSIYTNDTVINGRTSKLLRSEHITPLHGHYTLESFIQTDTGLISTFGGENGRSFGPYSPQKNIKLIFNGREFQNVQDIFLHYRSGYNTDLAVIDTTPVNCIKYPVTAGTEWHFSSLGTGLNIYKKYTRILDVNTPIGNFQCMEIQRIFKTPMADSNLIFYDYLSDKGMIKRDYTIKNISISNSSGQVIGYFDVKEEYLIELINGL